MEWDRQHMQRQFSRVRLLAALERVVFPGLFDHTPAYETLRVWIPDCATGEIAYAVASTLYAYALRRESVPAIQVFATDPDPHAIATARLGRPPARWLAVDSADGDADAAPGPDGYVAPVVRRLLTFATHGLLRDPPFANLHLIVSATLPDQPVATQDELVAQFHWSLEPDCYLLLTTDQVAGLSLLFAQHPQVRDVFRRRGAAKRSILLPASPPISRTSSEDQPPSHTASLLAMNQSLRQKISMLARANDDLTNLLSATNLATIFLNRELRITRFTVAAQAIFNLIPGDRGRPLAHVTHTLAYLQLVDDAQQVLMTMQPVEREVERQDGRWYLIRINPYRTVDDQIDGVVLIGVDITARRSAEMALRQALDELEIRVLERTTELSTANLQLQTEIAVRTRLEQERAELLHKLVLAQEEERQRISRELHDQLGQSVSTLAMGLSMLTDQNLDWTQRKHLMDRLQQITVQLDRDMRQLASDLRPTMLDDLGLLETLQYTVEQWEEDTGIQAEFQAAGLPAQRLPRDLENVVYRVIQEALTNILKHAQASHVSVILELRAEQLRVIIEDDGQGFDLSLLPSSRGGLGLLGMRERVALVGGTVTIETEIGAGTTIFAQLPSSFLAAEAHE